jgi:hypothetical protein
MAHTCAVKDGRRVAAWFASACLCAIAACGGPSAPSTDGGNGGIAIGAPCTPQTEFLQSFDGYGLGEVATEVPVGGQPGVAVCLVYHFQGLTTCPYGQDATRKAPTGATPCATPAGAPVAGAVTPQCVDRQASKVVFWSCRCANAQGRTDDGATYCACPSNMACTQIISSIGAQEDDFSGAYCLAPGIAYQAGVSCGMTCDPTANPCR